LTWHTLLLSVGMPSGSFLLIELLASLLMELGVPAASGDLRFA
jgi:hypothetical protein